MIRPNSPDGIIVLGAPRSGTTLLRRLLDAHPNISCPGETYLLSSCARFIRSDRMGDGTDMGVLSGLGFAGFSSKEVIDSLREYAFSFPRAVAQRKGKSRWAEKTAIDAFYIEEIEVICGQDAYFVALLRHGLDVACSCEELVAANGAIPLELHEFVKRNNVPLEAYCEAWVHATGKILDFLERHPTNSMVCRYEDLVREPEATLRQVLALVGEEWQPDLLDRALDGVGDAGLGDWKTYRSSKVLQGSIGRWRNLSKPMQARLARIANDTLCRAGYERVPAEAGEASDSDAKRRYELGLMIQPTRDR
ncbi:MAG: sulfotransferase [Woeseiaceae bacterium]